jgi:hypothetical protein
MDDPADEVVGVVLTLDPADEAAIARLIRSCRSETASDLEP